MSVLHMLDTDTVSYLIKGRAPQVESKLSQLAPSMVCVSVITQAKLMYGLKRLPDNHLLHHAVRQFLTIIRVIPWDGEAANYYAGIRHQLVSSGQPIGDMDMMIAAHSLSANAVLVTNNLKHYERIEAPITLVNWA
jgi:tRNA(fMet)-specific endonuclease VapC